MKVRVTSPNVYRDGERLEVGDTFEIKGDTIPPLYKGAVVPADQSINNDRINWAQVRPHYG